MTQFSFVFAPLLPIALLAALAALAVLALVPALLARARGRLLRSAFFALLIFALLGPTLEQQRQEALPTIALAILDRSASQSIGARQAQSHTAASALASAAERIGVELIIAETSQAADTTQLLSTLVSELPRLNPQQLGAVFLISDGQAHDTEIQPDVAAPVHLLLTGSAQDQDRSLQLVQTPRFGLLARETQVKVSVQSRGKGERTVPLELKLNGEVLQTLQLIANQEHTLSFELTRRGQNFVELQTPTIAGEMTAANNQVGFVVNGIRDRLRVLIISGHPHAGQRAWRDLLKSDPAVDLVHFNILREREDDVRATVEELSLIAFPVDQLFLEDLDGFDLIIFDRYFLRGHLRAPHLDAVANFVLGGGALLAVAGEEFSGPGTLYNGVFTSVLAARPAGEIRRAAFRPQRTELGLRHPVTAKLKESDTRPWGQWYRRNRVLPAQETSPVLLAAEGEPLLVLAQAGSGRTALLASDQIWLWARGHDGGGPEADLLRRLVHWLMREPELEEERLLLEAKDKQLVVERRSLYPLEEETAVVELTAPDGTAQRLTLQPVEDPAGGRAIGRLEDAAEGFWQATQKVSAGTGQGGGQATEQGGGQATEQGGAGQRREGQEEVLEAFALVGRNLQREFATPFSTPELLRPLVNQTGGSVLRLEEHPEPRLRRVRTQAAAGGRGDWLAVLDKRATRTLNTEVIPLLPAPLVAALLLALLLFGWRRESH